jgi:hypothetical protein
MPMVGGKKYPYTEEGKKQAKKAEKKMPMPEMAKKSALSRMLKAKKGMY